MADHFAAGLGVSPQLALDDHQVAGGIGEQSIDAPHSGHIQFAGNGDQRADRGIDVAYWQDRRIGHKQIPQPVFLARNALRYASYDQRWSIRVDQRQRHARGAPTRSSICSSVDNE